MNTKKILSAAAAVALVTTGLLAFETNTGGAILNSNYVGGTPAHDSNTGLPTALELSTTQKGDGLIFPYYKDNEGWKTQIVIRNTSPYATIAKVSIHEYKQSTDVGDFNIYLSPYDVLRFTIDDGKILTADGSIPTQVLNPRYGATQDKATFLDLDGNSETLEIRELDGSAGDIHEGYVVVYGMAQYHPNSDYNIHEDRKNSAYGQALLGLPYHQQHEELFKDYRRLMDDCRPNWRKAFIGIGMKNGVINVKNTLAPDVNVGASCVNAGTSSSVVTGHDLRNFGDVHPDTFIGTVRVYKADGEQSRDLLLPATALYNYSENNMYLWAEGEYAAMHDRRIEARDADDNKSWYPLTVIEDSDTFLTKSAYYTFDSKEGENATGVANQVLITQPTKKILVQRYGKDVDEGTQGRFWLIDGSQYGGFALDYYLIDEDENSDIIDPPLERITSPYTGSADALYDDELQKIGSDRLEDHEAYQGLFTNNDGYSYLNFIGGDERGLPAIVTEMTGTKINGIAQTNWLYTPTVKVQ